MPASHGFDVPGTVTVVAVAVLGPALAAVTVPSLANAGFIVGMRARSALKGSSSRSTLVSPARLMLPRKLKHQPLMGWTSSGDMRQQVRLRFDTAEEASEWLAGAVPLLESYFRLEDPTTLDPAERELRVETALDSGLVLRGYVDRLDRNAAGDLRVVDYKTGKAPGEGYEQKALFQMRFYALVLWRATGVVPRLLQLLYLGDSQVLRHSPDVDELLATERKVKALWAAIQRANFEQMHDALIAINQDQIAVQRLVGDAFGVDHHRDRQRPRDHDATARGERCQTHNSAHNRRHRVASSGSTMRTAATCTRCVTPWA